jgi:hypothetical protein
MLPVAVPVVSIVRMLLAPIQLAVTFIKFPVHPVPVAVELFPLAVQLRPALIGDVRAILVMVMMAAVLPLIDFTVAPVELPVHPVEFTMHLLAFAIQRIPLMPNVFVLLMFPIVPAAIIIPSGRGLRDRPHHHQPCHPHAELLEQSPFHWFTPIVFSRCI